MKKSVTVQSLPEPKQQLSRRERILGLLEKKPRSSKQLTKKLKSSINNIAPVTSHLKAEGLIREKICPCCDVGKMYEVVRD